MTDVPLTQTDLEQLAGSNWVGVKLFRSSEHSYGDFYDYVTIGNESADVAITAGESNLSNRDYFGYLRKYYGPPYPTNVEIEINEKPLSYSYFVDSRDEKESLVSGFVFRFRNEKIFCVLCEDFSSVFFVFESEVALNAYLKTGKTFSLIREPVRKL